MENHRKTFCICLETNPIGWLSSFQNLEDLASYYTGSDGNIALRKKIENRTVIPYIAKSPIENDNAHYLILVDKTCAGRGSYSLSTERYYPLD